MMALVFFRKIIDVAKLINHSALLRVEVDNVKTLIVDWTDPVLASGRLVLQKNKQQRDSNPRSKHPDLSKHHLDSMLVSCKDRTGTWTTRIRRSSDLKIFLLLDFVWSLSNRLTARITSCPFHHGTVLMKLFGHNGLFYRHNCHGDGSVAQ